MDISKTITRRVAFLGAGALSVATVAPVVAAARSAQPAPAMLTTAKERFRHHFAEMAKALDEMAGDADGWRLSAHSTDGEPWSRVEEVRNIPAPGAVIADTEPTPVMALFRRWQQIYAEIEADADELHYDSLDDVRSALERQIVATPPRDAQDILAKVIAYTSYGDFCLAKNSSDWGAPVLAEAIALFGGKAVA